jgi:hypothetical protein
MTWHLSARLLKCIIYLLLGGNVYYQSLRYIFFSPEDQILPGRPIPPECHTELHTDYGGAAVRWGLTHHKESAADCCQACLDHAKRARPGEKKCNIWVYCPSEDGCHSPDIYQHKHQECWLKYVSISLPLYYFGTVSSFFHQIAVFAHLHWIFFQFSPV